MERSVGFAESFSVLYIPIIVSVLVAKATISRIFNKGWNLHYELFSFYSICHFRNHLVFHGIYLLSVISHNITRSLDLRE